MGKGDNRTTAGRARRAEQRAQKRHLEMMARAAGVPPLRQSPRRNRNGGTGARTYDAVDANPHRVALEARARISGMGTSKGEMQDLSAPYHGSGVGRCIASKFDGDPKAHSKAMRVWGVWQGFCQAERAYLTRIVGIAVGPSCSQIAAAPEPMQTDQSHSVDLRTGDERDRDAKAAWSKWSRMLGKLSNRDEAVIMEARWASDDLLWSDAQPTRRGREIVNALTALADVVESS